MPKKARSLVSLARITRALPKTKPRRAHGLVLEAFSIAALAGDVARARRLLDALYRLPLMKSPVNALSTHAVDVYCAAAGFGDLGRGEPRFRRALASGGTLAERVVAIELGVRRRVATGAYTASGPRDWRSIPRSNYWHVIGRWTEIEALVHPDSMSPEKDREALALMEVVLADWPSDHRGPGYGAEIIVALDLAFRLGERATAARWFAAHGYRILRENRFYEVVCHPTLAKEMVHGFFRPLEKAKPEELASHLDAVIDAAITLASAPSPAPKKTPKIQRRSLWCDYDQVYLEPAELDAVESAQLFFDAKDDSERYVSLFLTKAAIVTPSEIGFVEAEVSIAKSAPSVPPPGAVQHVVFPLRVRGPLVLSSVTSGEDEHDALDVAPGDYDVLAAFFPPKIIPKTHRARRRIRLRITFCPSGSLTSALPGGESGLGGVGVLALVPAAQRGRGAAARGDCRARRGPRA